MVNADWLIIIGVGTLLIALLLNYAFKAFRIIGFDNYEVFFMLLGPLILERFIGSIFLIKYENISIFADPAGFFIPIILSIRFLASGRAPFRRAVPGILFIAYVANVHSTPGHFGVIVKDIGTLILITSLYSLYASRKPEEAGPIAYVMGTIGVILGADIANITNLTNVFNADVQFTIGGAGMFDAIYIVGLLSVVVDVIASSIEEILVGEEPKT